MKFYSQHGEDFLLDQLVGEKKDGFFVEVGCIDGRRFSNTLLFEEKGWKGLCVEAHAGYIELLKKNRPNSIICHCAAGEEDSENVTFYANDRGSLSTLDKSQESRFKEYDSFFTGFKEQTVSKKRLSSVFESLNIHHIDILSLDIEGYEVEALKGIDFNKIKPEILVIESDTSSHLLQLEQMLGPAGYHRIAALGSNVFFTTKKELGSKIANKIFRGVKLIHTNHPLDHGIDQIRVVDIDLREKTAIRKIFDRGYSFVRKIIGRF